MKPSLGTIEIENKKWYQNRRVWMITGVILVVLIIIILTVVLLVKNLSEKNNPTHIHYTRTNRIVYDGGYELYRLTVLPGRNPAEQYKLLAGFLRASLFNKSNYEQYLPNCPIIYSMSVADYPEKWRAMIFGTMKYPRANMPYPYICFLSVMSDHRRHKLGSILLNQFINGISKNAVPPVTHIHLHTNWENCRAQRLYKKCGFRCNEFTLNGYSKPFEPEYQFGHMIRMELNMANIVNRTTVCQDKQAVHISPADENIYTNLCTQNIPNGTNQTLC